MAYLVDITMRCARCVRPATVELVNNRNSRIGRYCKRCGTAALRDQQARERAAGEWSGG